LHVYTICVEEFNGVSAFESFFNFLVGGIRVAIPDVLGNGIVEEDWLLADVAYSLSEPSKIELFERFPINYYISTINVVEPFNQLDNGALP